MFYFSLPAQSMNYLLVNTVFLVSMQRTGPDYLGFDFVPLFLNPPPVLQAKTSETINFSPSFDLAYFNRGRCPCLISLWQSPWGSQQTSNLKGEVGPFIAVWDPLSLRLPYSLAQIIEIIQCRMCHLQFPGEKCSRGRGICTATMEEACTTGRILRSKLWVWGRRKGQRKQTGIH